MADVYRAKTGRPVNDLAALKGDDLLLVNGRVKAAEFAVAPTGPSQVAVDADGEVLYARIAKGDLGKLKADSIDALLDSAKTVLPAAKRAAGRVELHLGPGAGQSGATAADFAAAGRSGIEGTVEEPNAIRGSRKDVYVAPGAVVHPMVVIDAEHGPVYLDEGVEVHPFTRIEGPCYVGKKSILLGTKCREGNSIGPMCRVGGEVEESIIHGYSNKYHDGFLGHAYVGEWVNLGALTTNSDLKNDYSSVSVILDGNTPINTGSTKVGSLIGDHTKTSIGTLLNTGAYVGRDGADRHPRQAAAEVHPLVRLVPRGRGDQGFRQEEALRDGQDGHEPPQVRLDRGRRGPVGRRLRDDRPDPRRGDPQGPQATRRRIMFFCNSLAD